MLYLKNEYIFCLHFKTQFKSYKPNRYFYDSKRKRILLLCDKKISALLNGITSKYVSDSDCLNCFHPFRTKGNDNDTINKQTVQIV